MKIDLSKTKIFTVLIAIFYIFGLIAYFDNLEKIIASVVALLLILSIFIINYDYKKSIILFLIFLLGIFIPKHLYHNLDLVPELNINNATLKGRIISSKQISAKNQKIIFFINANKIKINSNIENNINEKILISLDLANNINNKVSIGDYIEIKGNLRTPKEAKNPYQFDYKKYLLNNNCKNILYGDSTTFKKLNNPTLKNDTWYYILKQFELTRDKIIQKHSKNIKSPQLEVLGSIVFGNETISPDENIKESFKHSGLLHLLAASGLNVALIYGIWWWMANLIKMPYNFSILSGAFFVILYTFMTGFPPSILRASLMLLFILFGKLIDRNADSIALVFFVAFLILLFNPKMIFDIGFQLSFMVTIGLIICCPIINSKFENSDKKFKDKFANVSRIQKFFIFLFSPKNIVSIFAVPLVAQLWVIPLQIYYFNNLAPLSILANIAVVPFIGILSFIGFLSSIIALIPKFTAPIIYIFDLITKPLLSLLINISNFFASFNFSLISTQGINIFQIFCFWGIILIATLNLKNNFRNKKELISLLVLISLFLLCFINPDYYKKNLEIIMFDVENADSFLIKTPKNKFIMVDTGKKSFKSISSGEIIINRYLKNKRINKLEKLIITHFDMDHCGGAIDILENTKTNEIIIQKDNPNSLLSKEIIKFIKENKLNYKTAKNNEIIYQENDLTIKTFIANINKDEDNENSIITLINYKNQNYLFMADVGINGFRKIEKYIPSNIQILKIGHHGAKNVINQKMINKLNPQYALISTGINKYNHPHYSTIQLLNDNNIKTISSKNYGFTKIIIDKNSKIKLFHFNSENKRLENILFDNPEKIPFYKSKFMQDFVKNTNKIKA